MRIIERPSPNFDDRDGKPIELLILHYTGMPSGEIAIQRLSDPAPRAGVYAFPWERPDDPNKILGRASAHYVVEENGAILRLVPEEKRAWHAGIGAWAGHADLNHRSIGIEIVNGGHDFGLPDYPYAQISAVMELVADITKRHRLGLHQIVGHSDVAPLRKADPGEKFPWRHLAEHGLALWPSNDLPVGGGEAMERGDRGAEVASLQTAMNQIGYVLDVDGIFGPATEAAIKALQRRFRIAKIDGIADAETLAIVADIVKQTQGLSSVIA
jgi:N-acetylmuramoyl-L-alanine amidase